MDQFAARFSQFDPNARFGRGATTKGVLCARPARDGANEPFFSEVNGFPASLKMPVRLFDMIDTGRWLSEPGYSVRLLASAKTAEALLKVNRMARVAAALRDIFVLLLLKVFSSNEIALGSRLFRAKPGARVLFAHFGPEKRFFVIVIT
jgi:hypothetical protein